MKLFTIFKKAAATEIPAAPETATAVLDNAPTVPSTSGTSTPDAGDHGNIVSITYGTGMPIDVIYAFISHDYEQDGYQDALVNADVEYCKAKENIILNQLNQLFRRVLLRYTGEIREIEVQIANARQLFALTSASQLEARKFTCEEHISEINEMVDKLKLKAPEMMTMIESYRRGFTKGCAARTASFLNPQTA